MEINFRKNQTLNRSGIWVSVSKATRAYTANQSRSKFQPKVKPLSNTTNQPQFIRQRTPKAKQQCERQKQPKIRHQNQSYLEDRQNTEYQKKQTIFFSDQTKKTTINCNCQKMTLLAIQKLKNINIEQIKACVDKLKCNIYQVMQELKKNYEELINNIVNQYSKQILHFQKIHPSLIYQSKFSGSLASDFYSNKQQGDNFLNDIQKHLEYFQNNPINPIEDIHLQKDRSLRKNYICRVSQVSNSSQKKQRDKSFQKLFQTLQTLKNTVSPVDINQSYFDFQEPHQTKNRLKNGTLRKHCRLSSVSMTSQKKE